MDLSNLPPASAAVSVLLGVILVLGGVIAKLQTDNSKREDERQREIGLRLAELVKVVATNTDIATTQRMLYERLLRVEEAVLDCRDMAITEQAAAGRPVPARGRKAGTP